MHSAGFLCSNLPFFDSDSLHGATVRVFDWACRNYQRLFRIDHPDGEHLATLHAGEDRTAYLQGYFDHEYCKGGAMAERFLAINRDWVGGRGLDFGCGGGGLTYRLREHCSGVVGIDLEADKIAFARSKAAELGADGVEFVRYDGGNVPLPDASFDVVFCVDVVEHLPDPERFVTDFFRLLKPGGWFLLSFGPPWYHPHGKHMWVKVPGWWSHLLFPRSSVMRTAGYPPTNSWADIGIRRLSAGKFERILKRSGFQTLHQEVLIKKALSPLKRIPLLRELFISEVVGIYRKPE